jgi:hypothetical protein
LKTARRALHGGPFFCGFIAAMLIQRQTITDCRPQTIAWLTKDLLIDWAHGGRLYGPAGQQGQVASYHVAGSFDRAITSADGTYAFIYQHRGTKGLLLKKGELLREISRSDYHAGDYEYPAAFATVAGVTYLIHCPIEYNQLDFEEVETGELVTNIAGRAPVDYFHSRLEVSPNTTFLLSKGWAWHPWDMVVAFDIAACLANPLLLDELALEPNVGTEVCTAGFLTDELVVLGTSNEEAMNEDLEAALPPESVTIWNIRTDELAAPVRVASEFGNLFPLTEKLAWDLYEHPKLLDLTTGAVVASLPELASSLQRSGIVQRDVPAIAFDRATGQLAFTNGNQLEILSWSH